MLGFHWRQILSEFVQTETQIREYPIIWEHSRKHEKKVQCAYNKKEEPGVGIHKV